VVFEPVPGASGTRLALIEFSRHSVTAVASPNGVIRIGWVGHEEGPPPERHFLIGCFKCGQTHLVRQSDLGTEVWLYPPNENPIDPGPIQLELDLRPPLGDDDLGPPFDPDDPDPDFDPDSAA
jgi:hypothetical protein